MINGGITAAERRVLLADAARVRAQQTDAEIVELPRQRDEQDEAVAS